MTVNYSESLHEHELPNSNLVVEKQSLALTLVE